MAKLFWRGRNIYAATGGGPQELVGYLDFDEHLRAWVVQIVLGRKPDGGVALDFKPVQFPSKGKALRTALEHPRLQKRLLPDTDDASTGYDKYLV